MSHSSAIQIMNDQSMSTFEVPTHKDPWDWTVDEVVWALCNQNAPFRAGKNSSSLPEPTELAQKLSESGIDGQILLGNLDGPTLKKELGITPLGHLYHIGCEINRLRLSSPGFMEDFTHDRPHLEASMQICQDWIPQLQDWVQQCQGWLDAATQPMSEDNINISTVASRPDEILPTFLGSVTPGMFGRRPVTASSGTSTGSINANESTGQQLDMI
ncbi:MAG: hypothetical protein Q9182_007403, partial [Xanthomendoza sp. 2 TL-2023]